jgi:hypothetical protein
MKNPCPTTEFAAEEGSDRFGITRKNAARAEPRRTSSTIALNPMNNPKSLLREECGRRRGDGFEKGGTVPVFIVEASPLTFRIGHCAL